MKPWRRMRLSEKVFFVLAILIIVSMVLSSFIFAFTPTGGGGVGF